LIDRKFHLLDALTGGAVYNEATAERELEAYVQERLAEVEAALQEKLPELRERIEVIGSVLPQVTTHNTSEWARRAVAIVDDLAALAASPDAE
jgi:hypothetical protein